MDEGSYLLLNSFRKHSYSAAYRGMSAVRDMSRPSHTCFQGTLLQLAFWMQLSILEPIYLPVTTSRVALRLEPLPHHSCAARLREGQQQCC